MHTNTLRPIRRSGALCLIAALLPACVTTHVGHETRSAENHLSASCANNPGVDAESFAVLTCTFENTSADWLDVKVTSLHAEDAKVSSPAEARAFTEAWAYKQAKDRHNTDVGLAATMIGGLALAIISKGGAGTDVGLGVAAGAAAAHDTRRAVDSYRSGQYGTEYGADHILASSMRIPPNTFLRRSVLLELDGGAKQLPKLVDICFSAPSDECISLHIGR